jgi:hypothetical protein
MLGVVAVILAALVAAPAAAAAAPAVCSSGDTAADCTWAAALPRLAGRSSPRALQGGSVVTPPVVFSGGGLPQGAGGAGASKRACSRRA